MRNPFVTIGKIIAHANLARSDKWPAARRYHLMSDSWCRKCGSKKDLQVHHIIPFEINPKLELNQNNLLTLCETIGVQCHLKHGHLGYWHQYNPDILKSLSPAPGIPASDYSLEIDTTITPLPIP